jgi:hypothetical protein
MQQGGRMGGRGPTAALTHKNVLLGLRYQALCFSTESNSYPKQTTMSDLLDPGWAC